MIVSMVDTTKVSLAEQMARFSNVRLAKHQHVATGTPTTFSVLGSRHAWTEEQDFVNFWASMTDRRVQAYMVGAWFAKEGMLGRRRPQDVTCWVAGGPRRCDFEALARKRLALAARSGA